MSENINCPFCSEEIKIDAIKCKHCGEFLTNMVSQENTSGQGKASIVPEEIKYKGKGFKHINLNWAAFLCPPAWAIANKCYMIAVISFITAAFINTIPNLPICCICCFVI